MARKKKTADMDVPAPIQETGPATADSVMDESAAAENPGVAHASDISANNSALIEPLADQLDPTASEEAFAAPETDGCESSELKLVPADDEEADADGELSNGASTQEIQSPELPDPGAPEITTQQVIEAILFAADTPLPLPRIVSLLGTGSARDVRNHIEDLNQRYVREGATFRIEKIAGGYQMLTLPQFNTWLRRLRQSRQDSRFSAAALETLSVVAYKQPVTRADIEAIRGVSAGEMLNRLRELNLVKIVGRADDVGRPMLYGTTKRFLEVFGLASLDELPQVEQLQIAQ